jgi:hypothetical protein
MVVDSSVVDVLFEDVVKEVRVDDDDDEVLDVDEVEEVLDVDVSRENFLVVAVELDVVVRFSLSFSLDYVVS